MLRTSEEMDRPRQAPADKILRDEDAVLLDKDNAGNAGNAFTPTDPSPVDTLPLAEDIEEWLSTGIELMDLATVVQQQNRVDEAEELFVSAIERLEAFLNEVTEHPRRDEVQQRFDECDEALRHIEGLRIAERIQGAQMIVREAEAAMLGHDYELAKNLYIEAVDIFIELEAEAEDNEHKAAMSADVIVLLGKAEKMKQLMHESEHGNHSAVPRDEDEKHEFHPTILGLDGETEVDELTPATFDDGEEEDPLQMLAAAFGDYDDIPCHTESLTKMPSLKQIPRCSEPAPTRGVSIVVENEAGSELSETVNGEQRLLEAIFSEMAEEEYSFCRSTSLKMNADRVNKSKCEGDIKSKLMTLFGFFLCNFDSSPLHHLIVRSPSVGLASALEESLARGIGNLKQLRNIDFASSGLGPAACTALFVGLRGNKTVITVNLNGNQILDAGATAIGSLINKTAVKSLALANNGISANGASCLVEAARSHTLYLLDLTGNKVGCDVVEQLLQLSKKSKTGQFVFCDYHDPASSKPCKKHDPAVLARARSSLGKISELSELGPRMSNSHELLADPTERRPSASGWFRRISRRSRSSNSSPSREKERSPTRASALAENPFVFDNETIVSVDALVSKYRGQYKDMYSKISQLNLLVAGQQGVGKSAIIDKALGFPQTEGKNPNKLAAQYMCIQRRLTFWDVKGYDPQNPQKFEEEVKRLLRKFNVDEDPTKHIHAVWYVTSNPIWHAIDEANCKRLFQVSQQRSLPVFILINKAELLEEQELVTLKKHILEAFKHNDSLKGVFTCVADESHMMKQLEEEHGVAGATDGVAKMLSRLHRLEDAALATKELLPEAGHFCVVDAMRSVLMNRDIAVADIIRIVQNKFDHAHASRLKSVLGRGKKYAYAQIGKMIQKITLAYGLISREVDVEQETSFGREFLMQLGLEDMVKDSFETLLPAIGILWAANIRKYLADIVNIAVVEGKDATHLNIGVLFEAAQQYAKEVSVITGYLEGLRDVASDTPITAMNSALVKVLRRTERELLTDPDELPVDQSQQVEAPAESATTMLEGLLLQLAQDKQDVDARDGFLSAYPFVLKMSSIELLQSMHEIAMQRAARKTPQDNDVCTQLCELAMHWLSTYFETDFMSSDAKSVAEDEEEHEQGMVELFTDWADAVGKVGLIGLSNDMKAALQSAMAKFETVPRRVTLVMPKTSYDPLHQYDSFLIAAHLTFHNWTTFRRMGIRDFFQADSPARTQLIHHANMVTYWVTESIVKEKAIQIRVESLRKILEIACHLQSPRLRDFHGFMAVMSGLSNSQVSRLRKTWLALGHAQPALVERFNTSLTTLAHPGNGNYQTVLDRVQTVATPNIPFFGTFLSTIERCRASGKNKSGDDPVGAAKIQRDVVTQAHKVLKIIPRLQQGEYDFSGIHFMNDLAEFFDDKLPVLFDVSSSKLREKLETDLMNKSLACEARSPQQKRLVAASETSA
eukprot:m.89148 g.89148  ORF g.89148 m.89148 type:complete len:1472 (+) comp8525_c0_seq2:181-4596(+)